MQNTDSHQYGGGYKAHNTAPGHCTRGAGRAGGVLHPIKPPPPHFLNEIAAGRNRQAARSQMLEAARKRVSERKDSKRSHTANMDYFTGDTINLRHLREEKRRAALIVDRANYLEHVEDTRKPLQLSKKEIEFHSYLSGNIYSQTIVLTNPGPTSRRYNILPPDAPLLALHLQGS